MESNEFNRLKNASFYTQNHFTRLNSLACYQFHYHINFTKQNSFFEMHAEKQLVVLNVASKLNLKVSLFLLGPTRAKLQPHLRKRNSRKARGSSNSCWEMFLVYKTKVITSLTLAPHIWFPANSWDSVKCFAGLLFPDHCDIEAKAMQRLEITFCEGYSISNIKTLQG